MASILNYFPDSDLRSGHPGLAKLSRKAKVPLEDLKSGQFNLFINRKQTALKMISSGGVLVHYKSPEGHRINIDTLALLPKYFNGTALNYNAALKEVLEKRLAKRIR